MSNPDDEYVRTMYHSLPSPQRYPDPKDAPADITVERRHLSRGPGFSKDHRIVELHKPRGRRDLSPIEHHRSSRSANPQRREMVLAQKGRRRRYSSESDSDSDYDTDGSSPRRVRSRKHYGKYLPVARADPVYANPPDHSRSMAAPRSRSRAPPGPPRRYDSESESSSDDEGGKKLQPKPPPKQILYTGLACVATVAAVNNVYQAAKAHHARKREIEGEISSEEARNLKVKARNADLLSLGVAAVGLYNVKNGWRRAEGHWKAHKERQAEETR